MDNIYSIKIINNDYSNIELHSDKSILEFNSSFDVNLFRGFFDKDLVVFSNKKIIKLLERHLPKNIVGVLDLFGKYKLSNNSRGIPGYVFTPLNKKLPKFIVHTKIKKNKNKNQLISVQFLKWENKKFPNAELINIYGDVDKINSIENSLLNYYQVIQKNKNKKINIKPIYNFTERIFITDKIYSIDPFGCRDIDDAFSVLKKNNIIILKIHISDVYSFISDNNLLDNEYNFSSIYLSDRVLHMLNTEIATNFCSLKEKTLRLMITLEIKIFFNKDNLNYEYDFYPSYGKVTRNCTYDDFPTMITKYYNNVQLLYNKITGNQIIINNSHKFIECLMIIYNKLFVNRLLQQDTKPILRSQIPNENKIVQDNELSLFLNIINSNSASYTLQNEIHSSLNMTNYTHSTSPIRRIVDLINQELFYKKKKLYQSISLVDINEYNKNLKKFYRKLNVINLANILYNDDIKRIYGYIYDVIERKIAIYIPEYNLNILYTLINSKIVKLSDLNYTKIDNNTFLLLKIENKKYCLPLYKKIQFNINGVPDISNIDTCIKIDIEPFLV